MTTARHLTTAELEAGLDHISGSPRSGGTLDLIVARPAVDERAALDEAELHAAMGLIGDRWHVEGSRRTGDGASRDDGQLTLMNARAIAHIARDPSRWALAGDQLYVDLDLSPENLPPGTHLTLGSAVIAVTGKPHRGCVKFSGRFGREALRFVNSPAGQALRLRGVYARVVRPGRVRRGDVVAKI